MDNRSVGGPVCSYNEWDPLEEVIVGRIEGAVIPTWDDADYAAHAPEDCQTWFDHQNRPFPTDHIEAAQKVVAKFVHILEAEGVKVRRPEPFPQDRPFKTPFWEMPGGFNISNPRDTLLVVGDEIIDVPTPRRGRYFESQAYRPLLMEYWRAGARWTAAPKPLLRDEFFTKERAAAGVPLLLREGEEVVLPFTEEEPVFEAADFMRCGRDIFYHRSYCTNQAGVDWLKRHLGEQFRFHEVRTRCRRPVHIDTTFVPLAAGKALANPEFAPVLPDILDKWDVLYCPEPVVAPNRSPYQFGSKWLGMNVFSIDSERVFVDELQESLIAKLRDWGFKPIPIGFSAYYPFGGGLHCSTLDVRRRGTLESYF